MITIALLGRPNVGKSSLFNRFAKERIAITSDISGTTRDTQSKLIDIDGRECIVVDTGGLDESSALFESVKANSLKSAQKADIILYLVDGKMYPDEEDRKLFYSLSKLGKPIALVVNKIDNDKESERAWEFGSFGAEVLLPISVSHNRGTIALKRWLLEFLPPLEDEVLDIEEDEDDFFEDFIQEDDEQIQEDDEDPTINIGIIGRVNVGKSSLLNALVGDDRAVVSDVAGTTIDPVDESMVYDERILRFVDTAGLRRRGKIEGIERYALNRTQAVLERTDIALLVLDGSEPFTELDERIAGMVEKFELGCIIVINKWDKAHIDFKNSIEEVRDRFKFLAYAPIITVSALSKKRVPKILDKILEVYANYSRRIPTAKLNALFKETSIRHPIPSDKGKLVKIYFATQFDICPPRIALVMNRPRVLHFSYKRYLMNQLRETFELEGTPIILIPRKRGESDGEEES
jgi:GTP-binding protein